MCVGALAALAVGTVIGARRYDARRIATQPPSAPGPQVDKSEPITLSFVGDTMLVQNDDIGDLLSGVVPILQADDLTFGNLECCAAHTGTAQDKQFTFRADPAHLDELATAGFDAVTLANNHSLDYGAQALLDTISSCKKAGIATAGAGANLNKAAAPAYLQAKGRTIAFLAASRVLPTGSWHAGPRNIGIAQAYDPQRLYREIRDARQEADIVVVYLHWGKERAFTPEAYMRRTAYGCIDAGADVVVGSHPHVLQGFEYYRGKLIAYSLGNFLFNSATTTAILQTTFQNGKMQSARVLPCVTQQFRPRPITDRKAKEQALQSLAGLSTNVTITKDGSLSEMHAGPIVR